MIQLPTSLRPARHCEHALVFLFVFINFLPIVQESVRLSGEINQRYSNPVSCEFIIGLGVGKKGDAIYQLPFSPAHCKFIRVGRQTVLRYLQVTNFLLLGCGVLCLPAQLKISRSKLWTIVRINQTARMFSFAVAK